MKSLRGLNTTSENSWSHCRSYIYQINGSWINGFLRKYTLFFPIEEALFWRFQVESILAWDSISWIILVINKCVLQISNLYYKVRCVSLCQHYNVRTLKVSFFQKDPWFLPKNKRTNSFFFLNCVLRRETPFEY